MIHTESTKRIFNNLQIHYVKRLENKKRVKLKERADKFKNVVNDVDLNEVRKTALDEDRLSKIKRRTRNNDLIASYYNRYAEETGFYNYFQKAKRVDSCCSLFDVDTYRLLQIKDVKRTNLCEDRFCDNCQANRAKKREEKYTPYLETLSVVYDLYHVVFTIPNVHGELLKNSLNTMFRKFSYLVRLLCGNVKIRNFDFSRFGFKGAIRALEITRNKDDRKLHPHFHCIFVCEKGLKLDKINKFHKNEYSFNTKDNGQKNKPKIYYFSDFEILLQKIWRLLVDGFQITKENIDSLTLGYDVYMNNARGKYHQIFKYATKGLFKSSDNASESYDEFVYLLEALEKRRIIEGYGIFHGFKFDSPEEFDTDKEYERTICYLRGIEEPVRLYEYFETVLSNVKKGFKYISRSSMKKIFDLDEEDETENLVK